MMALQRFRCALCLALVGMCLSELLPGLQPWVSTPVVVGETVEICTSEGTIRVALEQSAPGEDLPTPHAHQSDCPYCQTQFVKFLVSVKPIFHPPAQIRAELPKFFHQASDPLFVWACQPARAPPSVS